MEELGDILKRIDIKNDGEPQATKDSKTPDTLLDEVCEVCNGRGWITNDVPVDHPSFGQIVTCECQRERINLESHSILLRYSNLAHLRRFTFDSINPKRVMQNTEDQHLFKTGCKIALKYAEKPKGWLAITGPSGSGKTHLAAAIGNKCVDDGETVFFTHVSDLLDHLRSAYSPASEVAYSELFELVKTTPLLILDGLGSQSTTPWAEEKLRQIINHRYNTEVPTIFTLSIPVEEIDPYILTRLNTKDFGQIINLQNPDDKTKGLGRIQPELLRRMTFKNFDVRGNNPNSSQMASLEYAYQFSKNYASQPDGWLTLFGNTGAGKTHLAVAIAVEQINRGNDVIFLLVPDLLDHLRRTFSPDSSVNYDQLFEDVKTTPLLILDDLGQERSSPWADEKLYQIVVHRHNARLPTIITSMNDFTTEQGPIASRVKDPTTGELIKIDTPDYRNKTRRPSRKRQTRASK